MISQISSKSGTTIAHGLKPKQFGVECMGTIIRKKSHEVNGGGGGWGLGLGVGGEGGGEQQHKAKKVKKTTFTSAI